MKNTTLVFIVALLLFSCSQPTRDEIVKKNLKSYFWQVLADPSSYELVSLELIDSVTFARNIQTFRDFYQRQIDYLKTDIEFEEIYGKYHKNPPSVLDSMQAELTHYYKVIHAVDSIEDALGENASGVASYTYYITFRATNALGAKGIFERIVQIGQAPEFQIQKVCMSVDEMIVMPGGFPGYEYFVKNLKTN